MSKYKFSPAQRAAIFSVHGEACYLCSRPLNLLDMVVDHIIPESLADKEEALIKALRLLGRPSEFELNSYENWLPACARCNREKSDISFDPSPIVQIYLQRAATKAGAVRTAVQEVVSDRKVTYALNTLVRVADVRALKSTELEIILSLLNKNRQPDVAEEPIRLTPLFEVLSESNGVRVVRGPYGVGARPVGEVDSTYDCSQCGSIAAWNGARCVICGLMGD